VPFLINIYIVIINGNAKEKYIKLSLNSKLKGQKVNKGFWGWGSLLSEATPKSVCS